MPCRTGCPTQDHASWGECARSANFRVAWVQHTKGLTLENEKRHVSELEAYRDARRQGIQPKSTRRADIERAVRVSDHYGGAYDAAKPLKVVADSVSA